jgi:hypothetical protein
MPAVEGGWSKSNKDNPRYPPLTPDVVAAHLRGFLHIGLYPMLPGDETCWLAADFDGAAAMLDALASLKAALRASPGKVTAGVHDYHDANVPVLAAALAKRAPGYVSLGFPDPRGQ